jgi:hypothetical protein
LRQALENAADGLDLELPDVLPCGIEIAHKFPPRASGSSAGLPLPTLISRLLLAFRIQFDRESPVTLDLCANTLRVLSEEPIRESEIPLLTGASPETRVSAGKSSLSSSWSPIHRPTGEKSFACRQKVAWRSGCTNH